MVTVVVKKISEEDYLKLESNSHEKHEYEDGKLIPMGGASLEHNRIVINLVGLIWSFASANENLDVLSSDMRVFSEKTSRYYYPDLIIVDGKAELSDSKFDNLLNPSIIIEVLSTSTEARDRSSKFEAYRSIPSFREYILVAQDQAKIESFTKNDQGDWLINEPVYGIENTFHFHSINFSIKLKEAYQKIDFKEDQAKDEVS